MPRKTLVTSIAAFILSTIFSLAFFLRLFPFDRLTDSPFNQSLVSPLPFSQLVSPVATKLGISPQPEKIVYGFLPYWNISKADHFHYNLLTHVAYFGLDYNPNGTIKKTAEEGWTEPGWNNLDKPNTNQVFRLTKSHGNSTIIVMRGMTPDLIASIVNNPQHRQTLITETISLMQSKGFNGINIDFEYTGDVDETIRKNFSTMVKDLSNACKRANPKCEVSIDVFADSASNYRIWDFASLTPHLDYVIIMAYDFFRSASTQAGPVAPLRGACGNERTPTCLNYDIATTIADFSKIIPANKILLGVPYYGYEWQTAGDSFLANTYEGTGSTATYDRVQKLIKENTPSFSNPKSENNVLGFQSNWNEETLTPWIAYKDEIGRQNQIHYEDIRSLGLKYDLVNQSGIAGIAIWALGYDGDHPDLWHLLEQKFAN